MQQDTLHSRRSDVRCDWIEVPGGWFFMGGGDQLDEHPRHRVHLSPFRLARTPVTRAEYSLFLETAEHPPPAFFNDSRFDDPRQPVVGVSWFEAVEYCRFVSGRTGETVHLPTEAQWECAARGGRDDVVYPWGDAPPTSLPDYASRWQNGPEPVDLYPSLHPWGFLGLGENVHEWCADWYDKTYYQVSVERDPAGPSEGRRRASRGGAWRHAVKVSRCAARSSIPPAMRYNDYGFRLASPL